ncbi:MAG TPA: hypothetical protein VFR10_01340, partial [bacterium]|nr:hypothetical protein [bacterium]
MPANSNRVMASIRNAFVVAMLLAAIPAVSWADAIDELAEALETFRGLGIEGVESYRVPIRLPQDDSPNQVQLEEIWRRPSDLVIRGKDDRAPAAVVRTVALYLEPVYVARTAVVELDWKSMGDEVRSSVVVSAGGKHGSERSILIEMPPDMSELPATLRDVTRIEALLDAKGRLSTLDIVLRKDGTIHLKCEYDSKGKYNQPIVASWTLPSGDEVEVRTKYRRESGKNVPSTRQVIFPSRFDPEETEEILVEYGKYELNPEIPED